MYHSDDEDYGAARLLAFRNKGAVQKHINAKNDLITNLMAFQKHTRKVLREKAAYALGLKNTGKLLGNRRKAIIDKNKDQITQKFVNDDVMEALRKLFNCDEKLGHETAEADLMGMMLARFQVEFLSDEDNITSDPPHVLPEAKTFEESIRHYNTILNGVKEQEEAKLKVGGIEPLKAFLITRPYFMDVIVIHLAHNYKQDAKKGAENSNIRVVEEGYFSSVFDRAKGAVLNSKLDEKDVFALFMCNRIISMCNAYYKMVKTGDIAVPASEKTFICQSIDENKKGVQELLESIDRGQTVFSSRIKLLLNVLEHLMLEQYIGTGTKQGLYHCSKVHLKKEGLDWIVGSEPKAFAR